MPPCLQQVLAYRAYISKKDTLQLGSSKGGAQRLSAPIISGFLKGDGINADFIEGGSDWPHLDTSAGLIQLDARAQFRDKGTGGTFLLRYGGVMKMDEKIELALQWTPEAKTTKGGEHYWFMTPIFEVSSEEHKWMEQEGFVGQGHWRLSMRFLSW